MANGFVDEGLVYGVAEWEELEEILGPLNAIEGVWSSTKNCQKRVKNHIPKTLRSLRVIETVVKRYLMYAELEAQPNQGWEGLITCFSSGVLFNNCWRLKDLYETLLGYAAWRGGNNEFSSGVEGTRENLAAAVRALDVEDQVLDRQLRLFTWGVVSLEGDGVKLDLSDYIAWRIHQQHMDLEIDFFCKNRFYELGMDENLLRRGQKMSLKRKRDELRDQRRNTFAYNQDEEDEEERQQDAKAKRRAHSIAMDHRPRTKAIAANDNNTDFQVKHPLLSEAKKIFGQLASEIEEDVTAYFVRGKNSEFMLHHLDRIMRGEMKAGVARKRQFEYMDALHEMFDHGHLNTVSGSYARPMCLSRTLDVEPSQDVMVQHLLCMAKTTSVLQLAVEFVMFLMANIIGFTCHDQKPIIALNGPPGAGKSHTALAARSIAIGSDVCLNNAAFESQDYATIRALAAARDNEYERVSGTKFIEEWQCGDGGDNRYSKDTSMEATTFKNIWDKGIINTERCIKKDQTDRITSEKHRSLFSQSMIVLANGISLAPSLADRFLIYNVPHLTEEVHNIDQDLTAAKLSATRLVHLFSLYRYHISEGTNRRAIGLEIKEKALDQDLDSYETRLTFSRMRQVLIDMGVQNLCKKLNPRTENQIAMFAEVICRWRAVNEVLGFSHPGTRGETLKADRDRLQTLTEESKTLMMEKRTVLDPADLVSAATMVLAFSDQTSEVLSAIVQHLLDPNSIERCENGGLYIRLNTSMKQMVNDLRSFNKDFLQQSISDALSDLEGRKTGNENFPLPLVKRSSSTQKDRFELHVEAEEAALVFCNSQPHLLMEAEEFLLNTILNSEIDYLNVRYHAGGLKLHDGKLVFKVPQRLVRTFLFLRRLAGEEWCDYVEGNKFSVHQDFGLLRTKVARSLLKTHLQQLVAGDAVPDIDDQGFVAVPITDRKLRSLFSSECRSPTLSSSKPLLHCNGRKVHLAALTVSGQIFGKVVDVLDTVRDSYVQIHSDTDLPEQGTVSVTGVPPFKPIAEGDEVLRVHYLALDKQPLLHGSFPPEESKPRSFVRRMLCKDFTSMRTILCFDRETCYKTQKPEDAFHFMPVPPREELPEFSVPCIVGQRWLPNMRTSTERGHMHCTFHPDHRRLKLAYKQLLLKGKVQEARQQFPSKRRADGSPGDDSRQFRAELERLLEEEEVEHFRIPQLAQQPLVPYPHSMAGLLRHC